LKEGVEVGDPPIIGNRGSSTYSATNTTRNAASRRSIRIARVRWTAGARVCERRTPSPSDKKVGPPLERRVAHGTTVVICRLLDPRRFEASPNRVFPVSRGNLIA